MAFLQPALLLALPAVLIPLIIHLLHRRRFQEKEWGAMMFLREALQEKRGRRNVRHWLVLAMRMLAVAMLVLAMSRPLLGGWLAGWIGGSDRSVIILMDRSASMERHLNGGHSKREAAIRTLTATLQEAKPSEAWILDQPLRDPSALAALLGPTDSDADIPTMLIQALQHWKRTQQTKGELWIASDLQATSWRSQDTAAWADVQAAYHELNPAPALRLLSFPGGEANRSIRCEANQRQLLVTIQQDIPETTTIPLTLTQNEQTTRKDVILTGETTSISFAMPETGIILGNVALPEDGNARDNTAHFVFANETPPTVAIVCKNPHIRALLELAVSPTKAITVTDQASWKDEALILWQGNLTGNEPREQYLADGGQLLVFPSEDAPTEWSENDLPIVHWARDEGPLRDTRSGEALSMGTLRTYRYTTIPGEPIAQLPSAPWLAIQEGTTYCATLPLASWSTLGEGPILLPLVQRLLTEGQERFSKVHIRNVDRAPWQAGVWPLQDGWDLALRPLAEDDLEETSLDALGGLPFQSFTIDAPLESRDNLNEWWRPGLLLCLLFLLAETILTRVPRQHSREPAS